MLHLTKVAFGCSSVEMLGRRVAARAANEVADVQTRFRPKRADELVGGSLYWILKHRLVARQTILGFGETAEGKVRILLDANLTLVRGASRRAHQGWRYLEESDAPADLLDGEADVAALPPALAGELAALALL